MTSIINKRMKGKHNTNWLDKNPQNRNTKWRPRKLVSDVLVEMKAKWINPVSADEIKDIYLSLVNNTLDEIKEIMKDPNQPVLTQLVAKAMMQGKGIETLEKMFDRAVGKAIARDENWKAIPEQIVVFQLPNNQRNE